MKLIQYKENLWYWVDSNNRQVSPYYSTETEAQSYRTPDYTWDNWKAIDSMFSEKGYETCTLEKAEEFARKRNYDSRGAD